jgi:hypothetical protein
MTQPVESPERPAESKTAHQNAALVGDTLGGRIRRRYFGSPGVLRLGVTMGLTRRISRWSSSRLPLLATIQRRWSLGRRSLAGGVSALPYVRLPVGGDSQPLSAHSTQPMRGEPTLGLGPLDLRTLPGGRVDLQRTAAAQPTTGTPPQRSMASQGRGALEAQAAPVPQAAAMAQAASPANHLGASILRRHLGGPATRAVQRREAAPRQVHAPGHPTAGLAEDVHAAVIQRPAVSASTPLLHARARAAVIQRQAASASPPLVRPEARAAPRSAVGAHGQTAPVLRQSTPGSAEGVVQRTPHMAPAEGSTEAQRPQGTTQTEASSHAGSQISSDAGASPPAGGEGRPPGPVQTGPSSPTASGNLGTAILQRHLTGPGAWIMRRQVSPSGRAPLGRLVSINSFGLGRADAAVPRSSGRAAWRATQSLPTIDRPANIQREIDERFSPHLARVMPPSTGEGRTIENTADVRSRTGLMLLRTAWRPSLRATVPSGDTNLMRQPASLVARLPQSGGQKMSAPFSSRGEAYLAAPEMPLLRRTEHGARSAEGRRMVPDTRPSIGSGTTVDLFLQRARAETSIAPPPAGMPGTAPSPPAGEPAASGEAAPGMEHMESIDLERLADQVYTIIERRLIIERESLGL